MSELILHTNSLIRTFREKYTAPSTASNCHLNDIFKAVESIMLGDYYDENVIVTITSMNVLCQSDIGNLDCIVRLWKAYLPFLKKHSGSIGRAGANQLYSSLNNFVIEGIETSLTPVTDGDVQLTIKLQLLLFFMQRLFASAVLLSHHIGNSDQLLCLLHVSILRGYIATLSTEYESTKAGFAPKVHELYRKIIRENFLVGHHCAVLSCLHSWAFSAQTHPLLASKRLYALLGGALLTTSDMERYGDTAARGGGGRDTSAPGVCGDLAAGYGGVDVSVLRTCIGR